MSYLLRLFWNWRFAAVTTIYLAGYVAGITDGLLPWFACIGIFVAGLFMLDKGYAQ